MVPQHAGGPLWGKSKVGPALSATDLVASYRAALKEMRRAENDRAAADAAHVEWEAALDQRDLARGGPAGDVRGLEKQVDKLSDEYESDVEKATSAFNKVMKKVALSVEFDVEEVKKIERGHADYVLPPLKYLPPAGGAEVMIVPPTTVEGIDAVEAVIAKELGDESVYELENMRQYVDELYQAYKEADIKKSAARVANSPAASAGDKREKEAAYRKYRDAFDRLQVRRAKDIDRMQQIRQRMAAMKRWESVTGRSELDIAYRRFLAEVKSRRLPKPAKSVPVMYKKPEFIGEVKVGSDNFVTEQEFDCEARVKELEDENAGLAQENAELLEKTFAQQAILSEPVEDFSIPEPYKPQMDYSSSNGPLKVPTRFGNRRVGFPENAVSEVIPVPRKEYDELNPVWTNAGPELDSTLDRESEAAWKASQDAEAGHAMLLPDIPQTPAQPEEFYSEEGDATLPEIPQTPAQPAYYSEEADATLLPPAHHDDDDFDEDYEDETYADDSDDDELQIDEQVVFGRGDKPYEKFDDPAGSDDENSGTIGAYHGEQSGGAATSMLAKAALALVVLGASIIGSLN